MEMYSGPWSWHHISIHESALGLPERALVREVATEAIREVALRRIDVPEVWQEIEAVLLETTPENLQTWWNSVLWELLGMGTHRLNVAE